MEVVILPSAHEVCMKAAHIVARLVRERPRAVLGLCTGKTPQPVYAELVRLHREGLSFAEVTTFNLDEYVGIDPQHPASYHRYMLRHLFEHLDVPSDRVHIPDGAGGVERACHAYEQAIHDAGGIDLQLLGIGEDGHIAFNEPSSSLASRTRVKTLTPATRAQHEGDFGSGESVPAHVITMGVGTILEARRCLVLASGGRKAGAVAKMIEGPVTAMVPASALQLHPKTTALLDEAAASQLALAGYYRDVERHKPDWQRE